jgi:serine/threonine protein kinase
MALLLAQQEQLLCEIVDAARAMRPDNPQLRVTTGGRSGARVFLHGRQTRELDGRRPHADISELEAKGFLRKAKSATGNDYFVVTAEAHAERDKIAERESPGGSIEMQPDTPLDTKGWVPDNPELDSGANSVVHIARRNDLIGVMKVCSAWKPTSERYQRFVAEIQALEELVDVPGVMRVFDSNVPDPGQGRYPWYVMPQGLPLSKLRREEPLGETVAGLASIAGTLRDMHGRDYSHRDVKPSNLFVMEDGSYVVGDLGLIGVPEEIRRSLTREGKSLGPANFMAPEMVEYVPGTDARPADVYSLAKSTWALVAKRNYPLPGPQRIDERESLVALTGLDEAVDLDRLIEAATENDPSNRPTMAETAIALGKWAESQRGQPEDQDELAEAISGARARLASQLDEGQSAATDLKNAHDAYAQLVEVTEPLFQALPQIGASHNSGLQDQMLDATLGHPFLEEMGRPRILLREQFFAYAQIGEDYDGVRLAIACATALYEGQIVASALGILVYEVPPTLGSDGFAWQERFEAAVGTLTVDQETQRLARQAKEQMPAAIASFSELAERL